MIMLLKVHCKKCDVDFKMDIGEKSKDEIRVSLGKRQEFECPGHHVELNGPLNYWELGEVIPGEAPTEADWLADKQARGIRLYSNDEVRDLFSCDGFSMGLFCGKNKKTGESVVLDFCNSPEGHRYYY
jgi:hypothetical protein